MRSYLVLLLKIYFHQFELAQLLLYKQILQCQVLLILLLLLHLLLLLLLSLFLKNGRRRDVEHLRSDTNELLRIVGAGCTLYGLRLAHDEGEA